MANQKRTALVTGSSRGLGRAIAAQLGNAGYNVAVHYARSANEAERVAEELRTLGVESAAFGADVSDPSACKQLITDVQKTFGGLDVLVNNAGITRDTLALRMKDDDWQSVIDTNLSSAFYLSRAALRTMMRANFGRIVNISSVVGIRGNMGQANYVAAKAGLIGLTKSLAREYASRGITVNAVAPGFIESDMTDELASDVKEAYLAEIPVGRFGTPADIAAAVQYLVSDEAGYVTGQTLVVDGGMVMP